MPLFGIVYRCEQDKYERQLPLRFDPDGHVRNIWTDEEQNSKNSHVESQESPTIRAMKFLGMKEWMVDLARNGHYTDEQIERLMEQKRNLIEALRVEEHRNTPPQERLVTPACYRPQLEYLLASQPICNHQCCHRCRPYMKDRGVVSLDAVFNNEIEPLDEKMDMLPVMDARLLHNIGLRMSPLKTSGAGSSGSSSISTSSSSEYSSEDGDVAEGVSLTREQSNGGVSTTASEPPDGVVRPLQRALTSIIRNGQGESFHRHSSVTLPLEGTGALRSFDEDPQEFDLALFRSLEFNSTPIGPLTQASQTSSLTSEEQRDLDDAFTPEGEEVGVEGGVALTEEAVETHTPDIITQI